MHKLRGTTHYHHINGQVVWTGKALIDIIEFEEYLQNKVSSILYDEENLNSIKKELDALATTELASNTLSNILSSEVPKEDWEVGESLAECLLTDFYNITFPWNTERDKKTPKASLPGADLIGFINVSNTYYLALGEVKTSSDKNCPPSVLKGRTGMINQIDILAREINIHYSIIKWLHLRCMNTKTEAIYKEAIQNYLASGGKSIYLFGMLMRDTIPNIKDLQNRAIALSEKVTSPTQVNLIAWYFPKSISEWTKIIDRGA